MHYLTALKNNYAASDAEIRRRINLLWSAALGRSDF